MKRSRQWIVAAAVTALLLVIPSIAWLLAPKRETHAFLSSSSASLPATRRGSATREGSSRSASVPRSTQPPAKRGAVDEPEEAPNRISGVVLDPDGHPLAGATVTCTDRDPAPITSSSPEGRFELGPEAAGCLAVARQGDFFPSEPTTLRGSGNTLRLTNGATIEGTVVDGSSAPMRAFMIGIEAYQGALPERAHVRDMRKFQDDGGVFRWDHLPAGRYVLTASAEGMPPARSEPVVLDGAGVTRARIAILSGGTVRGVVTDSVTHAPIEEATVALDGATLTGAQGVPPVKTDSGGAFTLDGAPATGPFSIRVSADGHRTKIVPGLSMNGGGALAQNVELQPLVDGGPRGQEMAGVGAFLDGTPKGVSFARLVPGGPAETAGIVAGDVIERIDGEDASGMSIVDCMQRVRGPDGSRVALDVDRGGQHLTIIVQRRALTL